jgi:hypothetical protein
MKDNSEIDLLARPNTKAGKIVFIHSDGKKHFFYSCINDLSGDRLSAFDREAPDVAQDDKWAKSVFKDIKAKCKVISCIGDY